MTTQDPEPGTLLKRVPGPPTRTRAEAAAAFAEIVDATKRAYPSALSFLLVPKTEDAFRWRVALDCGCVIEEFTTGEDRFPDAQRAIDPMSLTRLPVGERVCRVDDHRRARTKPYREVVEWLDHEVIEHPDDPDEDPYGMGQETWEKVRNPGRSAAHWQVELSCGHRGRVVSLDVDWRPGDPPKLTTAKRVREMSEEAEAYWTERQGPAPQEVIEREHERRMLALRWPFPRPEVDCYTCSLVARITGYQRIGWLVSRSKTKPKPPPKSREEVARDRLAVLEAEAEKLRQELGEMGQAT